MKKLTCTVRSGAIGLILCECECGCECDCECGCVKAFLIEWIGVDGVVAVIDYKTGKVPKEFEDPYRYEIISHSSNNNNSSNNSTSIVLRLNSNNSSSNNSNSNGSSGVVDGVVGDFDQFWQLRVYALLLRKVLSVSVKQLRLLYLHAPVTVTAVVDENDFVQTEKEVSE